MRLLQLQGDDGFSLVDFVGKDIPQYAILSHTWGEDHEEISFKDLIEGTGKNKRGYCKLVFCGKQAAADGLQFFWLDTCCIDKSSSQELSEAINSMFRWYEKSSRCYVYLSDVSKCITEGDVEDSSRWKPAFRSSRWFTRGWTLQELIAPRSVEFFSREATYLGNKESLEQTIYEITGIALKALQGITLSQISVNERFSWAAKRMTKRDEDAAYCLLGIFDIQMPLIYGEGREKALKRLQKKTKDFSGDGNLLINQEEEKKKEEEEEKKKKKWMSALQFSQMNARQMTIRHAYAKTCEWLSQQSEYIDWLDPAKLSEHYGFLWMKGKPGTGKSTLMKFALANVQKMIKNTVVLSFFFNARGEDIEKSTIGTYRSLLLRLLEQLPSLQSIFGSLGIPVPSSDIEYQWTVESLKSLLEEAVLKLGQKSVICFIDALDECEEQQVRDMISFFGCVCERAVLSNIRFQVCLSSRHYPHITIQKGLSIVLEGQEGHSQDIAKYLESELKIGQTQAAQQIRNELQDRASGIFMWVVLVVGILNKEHDRGRMYALERRLREIPDGLHELFHDMLTRDLDNRGELILIIQWVLFAERPLSPEELYFAILSGAEPDVVTRWKPDEITEEVIERFILDSSKGLAEITTSGIQRVQFIHESVKDFFLKDGLTNIWPDLGSNLHGQSHERLKQCCLNYMSLDMYGDLKIPKSLPEASWQQHLSFSKLAANAFPFMEYAVSFTLYHANAAEGVGFTQAHFLRDFPLPKWVQLYNLLHGFDENRHTEHVTLLYVLAEHNVSELIRVYQPGLSFLEVEKERSGLPLFAAMATGSIDAFQVFVESLLANQSPRSQPGKLYEEFSKAGGLQHNLGENFVFSRLRSVFSYLARHANTLLLVLILQTGKIDIEIGGEDEDGRTPLAWAVEQGHYTVAKALLDRGVDVNACGRYGNALCAASYQGHNDVVQLLLERGADVNAQSEYYGNALQMASYRGNLRVVEMLLDKGADINVQGRLYGSAIKAASKGGHDLIVKALLDRGALSS